MGFYSEAQHVVDLLQGNYETEFAAIARKGGFSDADIQGAVSTGTNGNGAGANASANTAGQQENARVSGQTITENGEDFPALFQGA
jgi:hypothetical protein